MRRIILIATIIISTGTTADTATEIGKAIGNAVTSEPAKEAGRAFTNTTQATIWQSICEGDSDLSYSAHCYMTPSGKRAWEFPEGPERLYWMKIGQERHKRHIEKKLEQRRRDAQQAERMYKAHKMDSNLCDFWKDQAPSQRRSDKVAEYCG